MAEGRPILIVEDEDLIRDTYARRLEHEGFVVSQAPTGRDALRVARLSPPQLILLDVMLPDLSGLEVLKSLRADRRFLTTPVVLFTNLSQHMDKHMAARLGATDYLVKSEVAPADVVARVRQLLAAAPGQRPIASFQLEVNPEQGDAAALASLLGYPRDYTCARCGQRLLLQLDGDFSDPWSRSFRVRLRCPACRETHEETKGEPTPA
ncbi:MAG TPA: response regulator [Terriglobales bacterium]|jgi:DNA-binding response OmpR family regulator